MNPADSLLVLERYAIVILPALVVAEQFGLPLPAVPALLGIGALAAQGRASIPLIFGAMVVVALVVDFGWYELGRRRGSSVLASLCRRPLEPDSCLRRARKLFAQYGARTMLVAKFVPGLTAVVPPLAGMFTIGRVPFALYDVGGVLLWAGLWTGLGYVFSDAISLVAARVAMLEGMFGLILATALGAYLVIRYRRRRSSAQTLRTARIVDLHAPFLPSRTTPLELGGPERGVAAATPPSRSRCWR